MTITKWGYKPDGESRLFELPDHDIALPAGWSDDVTTITDPNKRTAEAITAAAGTSIMFPVKVAPPQPEEDTTSRRATMPVRAKPRNEI